MIVIKKIGVWSMIRLQALLGILIGFVVALGVLIISFLADSIAPVQDTAGSFTFSLGPAALIIFPLVGLVSGVIIGFLTAFLFNVSARFTGGIEVRTEEGKFI